MESSAQLWETIKPYAVNAPLVLLLGYAFWHWCNTGLVTRRFYKKLGFSRASASSSNRLFDRSDSILLESLTGWHKGAAKPAKAWSGKYEGLTTFQYTASRRRGRRDGRKKSNYGTKYSISIVQTGAELTAFCARPKRVLEAVDYIFDGKDIAFPDDDLFSKYYHVQGDDEAAIRRCLGKPLRELLLQVEGVSVETIGESLIFMRSVEYLDIAGNLGIELDSAVQVSKYLGSKPGASDAMLQTSEQPS